MYILHDRHDVEVLPGYTGVREGEGEDCQLWTFAYLVREVVSYAFEAEGRVRSIAAQSYGSLGRSAGEGNERAKVDVAVGRVLASEVEKQALAWSQLQGSTIYAHSPHGRMWAAGFCPYSRPSMPPSPVDTTPFDHQSETIHSEAMHLRPQHRARG